MGDRKRTIIVHAFKNNEGELDYSMSGYGVTDHEIKCTKDGREKMHKNESHLITFELADRTDLGLKFMDKPNCMWVSDDNRTCPDRTPTNPHSQIQCLSVDPDGDRIQVKNLNSAVQQFKFALNFVDKNGNPHQYDPVWTNGNGGQP